MVVIVSGVYIQNESQSGLGYTLENLKTVLTECYRVKSYNHFFEQMVNWDDVGLLNGEEEEV